MGLYIDCCQMQVGELVHQQLQKKQLQKKRQQLIRQQIKRRQKERVNLDQSSIKKGKIEKHKYIEKKKYQTVVEKARKIAVQLQDNANPNTFMSRNANFLKILSRTRQRITLDDATLTRSITAINAFGIANQQSLMNFTLSFDKQIKCQPRPFLIPLSQPQVYQMVVIVLPIVKQKQQNFYAFQSIKQINLKVWSHGDFVNKINNDKIFLSKVYQNQIKCFVKYQLIKNNKFYDSVLRRNIPIFPIDAKKVPYSLSQSVHTYPEYIKYLASHYIGIAHGGQQQMFRLKVGRVEQKVSNVKTIICEMVARLIERNKNKNNKLVRVSVKTASSINFQIYKDQQ